MVPPPAPSFRRAGTDQAQLASRRAQARLRRQAITCSEYETPRSGELRPPLRRRGCGGIGRRDGFRSRWASALGGSSPLTRIATTRRHSSRCGSRADLHEGMGRIAHRAVVATQIAAITALAAFVVHTLVPDGGRGLEVLRLPGLLRHRRRGRTARGRPCRARSTAPARLDRARDCRHLVQHGGVPLAGALRP